MADNFSSRDPVAKISNTNISNVTVVTLNTNLVIHLVDVGVLGKTTKLIPILGAIRNRVTLPRRSSGMGSSKISSSFLASY